MRRTVTVLVASLLLGCATPSDGDGALESTASTTTTRPSTTSSTTSTTETPSTTTTTAPVDVFALRPPSPPASPSEVARSIGATEAAIRDPATAPIDLARAALAQQVAYRQLGGHPDWDAEVLAALPASLHDTVRWHAAARREFRALHTRPSQTLPAWRIVEPAPADELRSIYEEAGAAFDIPWTILAAINLVETGTGRIRGTSTAGAQGPMQFMPATWEAYGAGGDINDTRDAIFGAARYLSANNGATDIDNVLFRYNHSGGYVRGVKLYSAILAEHPRAFLGLHLWGVWYVTTEGEVYLPVGYEQAAPIPVSAYQSSR